MKNVKIVKKHVRFIIKMSLSSVVLTLFLYIGYRFEYLTELSAFDNIVGFMPLFLLTGISSFTVALIWKRYENRQTSTIVLSILTVMWTALLIPAVSGNWYPFAKVSEPQSSNLDLSLFEPFREDTLSVTLQNVSLTLTEDLPLLDGATSLYPVYASAVKALYDENAYTQDTAVCSNTAVAYDRLIHGDCDIIFVAGASKKQMQAALKAGRNLHFTPIGKEAFVFLVGKDNPIDNLTYQQIKNIFSGKTAYWHTLGVNNSGKIIAFTRPEGSGSQTALQQIMKDVPIQKPQPLPDEYLIGNGSMMEQVSVNLNGTQPAIGYSYRFFATKMHPNPDAKLLKIDGIYPSYEAISNDIYPFTYNFYAVTNGEPNGNEKILIDWILSPEGQTLIEKTGYIPLN
ncbi:MAG: substrate-binding domain-containing protein [Ruminococcus sp.]|nr:substrate-binding domain-containing protein [Ruminococcus sp.]